MLDAGGRQRQVVRVLEGIRQAFNAAPHGPPLD